MYKTNIILRTVFFFAYILAIILIGEKNMFWPILIYLFLITLKDRNVKSLLLDVNILIILLFALYTTKISIFLKLVSIINLIILYIGSFTKGEIKDLKYNYSYTNIKNRKNLFLNTYLEKIKDDNAKKFSNYSYSDMDFNNKLNDDLNRLYLYGKVRFYGYNNKMTNILTKWTLYDLVFLIVSVLMIISLRINWS